VHLLLELLFLYRLRLRGLLHLEPLEQLHLRLALSDGLRLLSLEVIVLLLLV
jgi:hypothetical protein